MVEGTIMFHANVKQDATANVTVKHAHINLFWPCCYQNNGNSFCHDCYRPFVLCINTNEGNVTYTTTDTMLRAAIENKQIQAIMMSIDLKSPPPNLRPCIT